MVLGSRHASNGGPREVSSPADLGMRRFASGYSVLSLIAPGAPLPLHRAASIFSVAGG